MFTGSSGSALLVELLELRGDFLLNGGSGDERVAGYVIDDLGVDVHIAAINAEPGTIGRPADLFTHAGVTNHANLVAITLGKHLRYPPFYFLPALPSLRRMTSFS